MIQNVCLILLGCFLFGKITYAETPNKTEFAIEQGIIEAFKTNNPSIIAKYINYPLRRPTPVPYVDNEQEFIERFDMLFDDELKSCIINSKPTDWEIVGWRGTMLGSGIIWLDDDGKIRAINNSTEKEQAYANELTQQTIEKLYPELRTFKANEIVFDIPLGHGRIDAVENPNPDEEDTYRYAFWNKGKDISDKPDMLIYNGTVEYQGTANNTYYRFNNGNYTYQFEIMYIGNEDTLPYALVILKDGIEIATYEAKLIQ